MRSRERQDSGVRTLPAAEAMALPVRLLSAHARPVSGSGRAPRRPRGDGTVSMRPNGAWPNPPKWRSQGVFRGPPRRRRRPETPRPSKPWRRPLVPPTKRAMPAAPSSATPSPAMARSPFHVGWHLANLDPPRVAPAAVRSLKAGLLHGHAKNGRAWLWAAAHSAHSPGGITSDRRRAIAPALRRFGACGRGARSLALGPGTGAGRLWLMSCSTQRSGGSGRLETRSASIVNVDALDALDEAAAALSRSGGEFP